jgi:hypothetical protein
MLLALCTLLLAVHYIGGISGEEDEVFTVPILQRAVVEHEDIDGSKLTQYIVKKDQSMLTQTNFDANGRWIALSKYTDSTECASNTKPTKSYERTGVCMRVRNSYQIKSAMTICGTKNNEIQRFYFTDRKCKDYVADEPLPTDSCSAGFSMSTCVVHLKNMDHGMGLVSGIYEKIEHAKRRDRFKRAIRIEGPRYKEIFGCQPYTKHPKQTLSMKFSCQGEYSFQVEFFKEAMCMGEVVKQKTLDTYPMEILGAKTFHAVACGDYQYIGKADSISIYGDNVKDDIDDIVEV